MTLSKKKMIFLAMLLTALFVFSSCQTEEAKSMPDPFYQYESDNMKGGMAISVEVLNDIPAEASGMTCLRIGIGAAERLTNVKLTVKADGFRIANGAGEETVNAITVSVTDEDVQKGVYQYAYGTSYTPERPLFNRFILLTLTPSSLEYESGTVTFILEGESASGKHSADIQAVSYCDGKYIALAKNGDAAKEMVEVRYEK